MCVTIRERVWQAIEQGDTEEGLRILAQAKQTDDHEQLFYVAELYRELGHLEEAKEIVETLIGLYPDEGSLYMFAAEMMIDLDEEEEAIELLLEIQASDQNFLQAQLLLADLYQLQALDEVAEQKLLAAYKQAPEEMILTYALGEFYLQQGAYNKAIPYLKRAFYSGEDFGTIDVGLALAEAYSATGQFEEALALYEQSADEKKMSPTTMHQFGLTAYQAKDYVVAIEQLEAVKTLDPDFTSVYAPLAAAYEAEGRLDEALETVKTGMKLDEFNDALPLLAGRLALKKQAYEQAEPYLRQAMALNPANVEALQVLSMLLREQDRPEELLELILHAREFEEVDVLFTWHEAYAHAALERYDEAAKKYEEAYMSFREDGDFLAEYGLFLLEEGQRARALLLLRQALQQNSARTDLIEVVASLEAE
ncbi:tetratricopeptide repeat protein [Shouchella lonarensis]|uniref:tetratricopeptide repeat protein n=1 Tax=Shouchella lonarensis TaxID=1464122 RepID=UPI000B88320E|nr:tetratricopeptide repeat protein [Shouchella lonarensis]